jgi:uncharacterized phage protein gp47/JayE
MGFSRPTLRTLLARSQSDLQSRLTGASAKITRSVEYVLATVLAALAHGAHGHIAWAARQLLPDTAESEQLERWAGVYLNDGRKDAVKATGDLTLTGTNGYTCPAGTEWESIDEVVFTQDDDATIAAGVATVAITAKVGGEDGNIAAGQTLALVSPVTGITSKATVASGGTTGGIDQESDDELRDRVLDGIRTPPRGGATGDYVRWAREVDGITRAWEDTTVGGLGTVAVYCVMDDHDSSILPDGTKVAEVQAYLDARRPVTADVTVYAPSLYELDLTIDVTPDTADVRAAIAESISEYLLREGEPGGTLRLSQIREAISAAEGEEYHSLTLPAADVTIADDEVPVLGTITWA